MEVVKNTSLLWKCPQRGWGQPPVCVKTQLLFADMCKKKLFSSFSKKDGNVLVPVTRVFSGIPYNGIPAIFNRIFRFRRNNITEFR